jgi:hypothetical protein
MLVHPLGPRHPGDLPAEGRRLLQAQAGPADTADRNLAGVAVVACHPGGGVTLAQLGQAGRADTSRRATADRWAEEQIYGRLLAAGVLDTEPNTLL